MGSYRDKQRIIRVFLDAALFFSVLFAPWWVSLLIAVALVSVADAFEILFAGIAIDALYGTAVPGFAMIEIVFTGIFALVFILAWLSKRYLLVYDRTSP